MEMPACRLLRRGVHPGLPFIPIGTYAEMTDICLIILFMRSDEMNYTSGYRTPIGNGGAGGENTSLHQYGKAFDFVQSTSEDNWYAHQAAMEESATMAYLETSGGFKYYSTSNPPVPPDQANYWKGHAQWAN